MKKSFNTLLVTQLIALLIAGIVLLPVAEVAGAPRGGGGGGGAGRGGGGGGGKQSVPGRPVLFRRRAGASGPFGVVGQEGEAVPDGYELLTGAPAFSRPPLAEAQAVAPADRVLAHSRATQALVDELTRWRSS